MNGANEPGPQAERHYGEKTVVLKRGRDVLHGVQFFLYPVDEPPLIEVASVDRRWYRDVWEMKGWRVFNEYE